MSKLRRVVLLFGNVKLRLTITTLGLTALAFAEVGLGIDGEILLDPDVEAGHSLANDACSSCHDIEPNGDTGFRPGPAFAAIAAQPDKTVAWFQYWLTNPHPYDPIFSFSQREMDVLAAYFETLSLHDGPEEDDFGYFDPEIVGRIGPYENP